MATEQILPGVYRIGLGYVNAFLIAGEDAVLIDSGLPNRRETILKALAQAGRKPEDLKHIAITHDHVDHTGSVAALVQSTGAKVYIHPLDAPVLRGDQPQRGPNQELFVNRLLGGIVNRLALPALEPAEVDQEVSDGDELPVAGGMKVIHAPGHTPGSVAFLKTGDGGVLFAGDAAGNVFGRLGPPVGLLGGLFTQDMAQARESFRKLAALEFDVACFGHGRVLKDKAHAAFRRYVEKMAR